jgi:hypothetical protein
MIRFKGVTKACLVLALCFGFVGVGNAKGGVIESYFPGTDCTFIRTTEYPKGLLACAYRDSKKIIYISKLREKGGQLVEATEVTRSKAGEMTHAHDLEIGEKVEKDLKKKGWWDFLVWIFGDL